VDVPLPWERVLWSCRAPLAPRTKYVLTDFRFVCIAPNRLDEIAIDDVGDVQLQRTAADRLLGTSTLIINHRRAHFAQREPFVLRRVRRGAQLAALVELLAGDPRASWDRESVQAALAWEPALHARVTRQAIVAIGGVMIGAVALVGGLHGKAAAITYPPDDAIYPHGVKRDQRAIVWFMEREVMPWARQALAPIVGGAERVSCETCHAMDAVDRKWAMPSVAALPMPDVTVRGWETYSSGMDAQMRNAIYGYIAESDNQAKAAYMREIVMPGMARLLHRPAYDFTRTYEYNRSRLAFGCYHCHRVN
jgi:hypothetical protein